MFFSSTLVQIAILVLWIFARLSNCQGSYGFTADSLTGLGACIPTGALSSFVGCSLSGSVNSTFQITAGSTNIIRGTGYTVAPFHLRGSSHQQAYCSGGGICAGNDDGNDLSFPGLQVAGENYWTVSDTPYNCTMACRSHGMKYTIMTMGYCNCSPYWTPNITTYTLSGIQYTDNVYFPKLSGSQKTTCSNNAGSITIYCFGDFTQTECGWIVTSTTFNGNAYFDYGNVAYVGNYANAIWVDNTFAADSTLVASTEQNNYGYIGCFNIHAVTGSLYAMFVPLQFANTFTTMSNCFLFCANVNMPYAGMLSTSPGNIQCACGTSFARASHQSLPDSASSSQCNYGCTSGTAGCTFGTNCCGHSTASEYYAAVYRNPNYLGCYEPPYPGTQIAAVATNGATQYQQTYPNACFQTVVSGTSTATSRGSATSTGILIITTTPPQLIWNTPTYPQYEYLGCYLSQSIPQGPGVYQTAITFSGTFTDCMVFCSTAGPSSSSTAFMATFIQKSISTGTETL
ncbi:hypothetical protein BDZ45DRAFT_749752 [Acephala macrosclerotiorum]|nr:hypothetical protein BDZ45DRAFT_749752 [Acephala macrosclerotiorum]